MFDEPEAENRDPVLLSRSVDHESDCAGLVAFLVVVLDDDGAPAEHVTGVVDVVQRAGRGSEHIHLITGHDLHRVQDVPPQVFQCLVCDEEAGRNGDRMATFCPAESHRAIDRRIVRAVAEWEQVIRRTDDCIMQKAPVLEAGVLWGLGDVVAADEVDMAAP